MYTSCKLTSIQLGRIPYLALTPVSTQSLNISPTNPLLSRAHVLIPRDHPLTAHDLRGNFLSSDQNEDPIYSLQSLPYRSIIGQENSAHIAEHRRNVSLGAGG
ncbi:hypothetical protein H9L39_08457 [Fusarium oxysporum f. sp. albedinis]|nr:hypothetical protein H9L39_08457 [Fusarium oxysporum f. sp. albedinis]